MQYKYDAGGRSVMKVAASETTYCAFGSEYSSVSGWRRVFVSAGGVKVEYRDNQTYFHQTDHLGTTPRKARRHYRGIEFPFSKTNSVDSCGIEGVEVVKHLPLPRWSVSLRLSDDSARFLVEKKRVLFGVFLDGAVRYVGPWLRWRHNQLDRTAPSAGGGPRPTAAAIDA